MKIALFFTENSSLRLWAKSGILQRDSLLYEHLCDDGHEVYFVTHGNWEDTQFLPTDSKIKVLSRPKGVTKREYAWRIHEIHGEILQHVDVIKSHQVNGARFAVQAKRKLKKPYIARCGYLPSYFYAQENASITTRIRNFAEELVSFNSADVICVPSEAEIRYLKRRYRIRTEKAMACPNWVDTDFFAPNPSISRNSDQITFIARFNPQKDPLLLLEAMRDFPQIKLLMVGGGMMKEEIEQKIAEYNLNTEILDRVSNEDLPRYYNECAIYALPTRYEGGSPKTLFEAMACETPIISTDGFGVNEAFEHQTHGYKISVGNLEELKQGIRYLLDNPDEAAEMGKRARQHVIDNFSVEKALERERLVLKKVVEFS